MWGPHGARAQERRRQEGTRLIVSPSTLFSLRVRARQRLLILSIIITFPIFLMFWATGLLHILLPLAILINRRPRLIFSSWLV